MSVQLSENASVLFDKLEKFFTSRAVVGEAIHVEGFTLIPIVNISFGMGIGAGDGADEKGGKGSGGGNGVGAKAVPTALVVINKDHVEIMPLGKKGAMETICNQIPDLIDKINLEEWNVCKKQDQPEPEPE